MPMIEVAANVNRRNRASLTDEKNDQNGFFVFVVMKFMLVKVSVN